MQSLKPMTIGLLCLCCSIVAVIAWLITYTLIGFNVSNIATIFPAFVAMSNTMSGVFLMTNFSSETLAKKFAYQILMSIFSIVVMYGTYRLAIYIFF